MTELLVAGLVRAETIPTSFSGQTMGTSYSVKAYLPAPGDRDRIQRVIQEELDEVNALMSTYLPDSEVSRFNRAPANEWFDVSQQTAYVVAIAQETAEATGGAFDITVNPLVELWKFGPAGERRSSDRPALPSDSEIAAVMQRVGYDKLQVQRKPPQLRKTVDGLEIDLSAIAKGYAVDRVWHALNDWGGMDSYMIEVGGEVRVRGEKHDGEPWVIAIEAPLLDRRQPELILAPQDTAIASSGDYRNFFEVDGVLYSHTIDPRTGRPVSHSLSATTVTSADCIKADALATALMVMGPEEGLSWSEENEVAALFLSRSENGVTRQQSSRFTTPEVTLEETPPTTQLGMTILMALIVFGVVIVGMSIGVIVRGKRLQGSCGGLAGMKDSKGRTICDACTNPSPLCSGEPQAAGTDGTSDNA